MTEPALVKQSVLRRAASVAKQTGQRIEIEVGGIIFRVFPDITNIHRPEAVDPKPEEFTSLADWQAWRERERARETKRRS
jgi:hypothetical protein